MKASHSFSTKRAIVLAVTILIPAGCTQGSTPSAPGPSDASIAGAPSDRTVAQILQNRSEFSDFRDVVKTAGLWESLDTSQGLTVLAPTNAAFNKSDPSWRVNTQTQDTTQGNGAMLKRQALIQTAEITGIHPPSDFIGKVQNVRSIGGAILHFDGMTPGVIKITTGSVPVSQFGQTPSRPTAIMQTPPLRANNGLVYSIDEVTVHDQN